MAQIAAILTVTLKCTHALCRRNEETKKRRKPIQADPAAVCILRFSDSL